MPVKLPSMTCAVRHEPSRSSRLAAGSVDAARRTNRSSRLGSAGEVRAFRQNFRRSYQSMGAAMASRSNGNWPWRKDARA
jgi:hypothetical protein